MRPLAKRYGKANGIRPLSPKFLWQSSTLTCYLFDNGWTATLEDNSAAPSAPCPLSMLANLFNTAGTATISYTPAIQQKRPIPARTLSIKIAGTRNTRMTKKV